MLFYFSDKNAVKISPSIVVFTVFFLLALYLLYFLRDIVIVLFLAFIVMVALHPAVKFLHNRLKLPVAVATFFVYLLMLSGVVALLALIIPTLSHQLYQIFMTFKLPPEIEAELNNFTFSIEKFAQLVDSIGGSINTIFRLATSTFSGFFTLFTLIVISFYLMLEREDLHKKAHWFTHDAAKINRIKEFLDTLETHLGGWVRGEAVLMFSIGLLTYIGLSLLGIPYALPLAILAGILEILPNIGPTISAIPAAIIAFLVGGWVMALAVIILYIVVQALENYVLVPKIMRDNVDVNPLVSLIAILAGLALNGVIGALLAIPTYILFRTAYSMWHQKHREDLI